MDFKPYVLLVEDNPVAMRVEKMLMKYLNCEVDCAESGEEAVDLAHKRHYDLILMDLGLPGLSGVEACQAIRAEEKRTGLDLVPIVAVTANVNPSQHALCLEVGMSQVFVKPFTPQQARCALTLVNKHG
jgi:CheY-like chemotaxis protein